MRMISDYRKSFRWVIAFDGGLGYIGEQSLTSPSTLEDAARFPSEVVALDVMHDIVARGWQPVHWPGERPSFHVEQVGPA